MIYYNSDKVKNIKNISDNSLYVVTDFDRTLTLGTSKSSWEILSSSFVDKNYIVERDKLAKIYRPIEVDETIDEKTKNKKMIEWWQKHIELLIKYKLKEEVIIPWITKVKNNNYYYNSYLEDLIFSLN